MALCRRCMGRLLHFGIFRFDIAWAVRDLLRFLARSSFPTVVALRRLALYLAASTDGAMSEAAAYIDVDWGCKGQKHRSVSGGGN